MTKYYRKVVKYALSLLFPKLLNLSGILIKDIIHAENSGLSHFVSVARTINNWILGILNSFTTSYTNGYIENYKQ